MNFIKNHHESICFLKNQHFDPYFTLPLLLFASLPIEFYCGKKWKIFQNFRNSNFYVDIWIQLQKLSILMCGSTTLRQSTPNHDFFFPSNQSSAWAGKSTFDSNSVHGTLQRITQIRADNSKLCNISESNIMILFWYQLKNSRPTFLNMNFIKNHHD